MSDRAEIFIMDRLLQMIRHVFEEKILSGCFQKNFRKIWLFIGSHLATVRDPKKLSDLPENFSGDSYDSISEVVLSFCKNLTFFIFNYKNTKRFLPEPCVWCAKPYKYGWKRQKLKRPILPLRNASEYLWWKFQPNRTKLKRCCPWHNSPLCIKTRFWGKREISLTNVFFHQEKFEGRFIRILWAVSYGESDEHIFIFSWNWSLDYDLKNTFFVKLTAI